MAESVQTTFEEAKRCPKCGKPGEEGAHRKAPNIRGAVIVEVWCRTELCKWFNTPWMVQLNADGSVPPPTNHAGQDKLYQGFEGHDEAAREIMEGIRRETILQVKPGAEIRRPR